MVLYRLRTKLFQKRKRKRKKKKTKVQKKAAMFFYFAIDERTEKSADSHLLMHPRCPAPHFILFRLL